MDEEKSGGRRIATPAPPVPCLHLLQEGAYSGSCTSCPDPTKSHYSCRGFYGQSFFEDANGTITTSFSATVNQAKGGCCTANSCVNSYFESQVFSMAKGDQVYFDYKVICPPRSRPAPAPHRPAPPLQTPSNTRKLYTRCNALRARPRVCPRTRALWPVLSGVLGAGLVRGGHWTV